MKNIGIHGILLLVVGLMMLKGCLSQPTVHTPTIHVQNKTNVAGQYAIELMMNQTTKTALCEIRLGRVIIFYFRNKKKNHRMVEFDLHVDQLLPSGSESHSIPCHYHETDQIYKCQVMNLVLLDDKLKNVKFNLFASHNGNTIWRTRKPLNIVKHVFAGCLPKTPKGGKPVLKTEMSSIDIDWKVNKFVMKLKPTIQVLLDGHVKHNITIHSIDGCTKPYKGEEKGDCKASITNLHTCVPHTICLRTVFTATSHPFFSELGNNVREGCWETRHKNCTKNSESSSALISEPGMKDWIIVLLIILTVAILMFSSYIVWKRYLSVKWRDTDDKQLLNRSESDDLIQPRPDNHDPKIKPRIHNQYADINYADMKSPDKDNENIGTQSDLATLSGQGSVNGYVSYPFSTLPQDNENRQLFSDATYLDSTTAQFIWAARMSPASTVSADMDEYTDTKTCPNSYETQQEDSDTTQFDSNTAENTLATQISFASTTSTYMDENTETKTRPNSYETQLSSISSSSDGSAGSYRRTLLSSMSSKSDKHFEDERKQTLIQPVSTAIGEENKEKYHTTPYKLFNKLFNKRKQKMGTEHEGLVCNNRRV